MEVRGKILRKEQFVEILSFQVKLALTTLYSLFIYLVNSTNFILFIVQLHSYFF